MDPTHSTELEIVETWARRHLAYIYRGALARLADKQLAEDVTQDTFIKALGAKRKPDRDDELAVKAWLATIMRNTAANHTRKRNREARAMHRLVKGDDKVVVLTPTDPRRQESSGVVDYQGDTRRSVKPAILELPEKYREVLVMRYWIGMSESEMSEELQVPTGTIKSRLSTARKMLEANPEIQAAIGARD